MSDTTSPTLWVLAGEPGIGKSFVAAEISRETGADRHEADRIRKNVVADGEPDYSREESQATYDTMFRRARESLTAGRDAVLDATFSLQMGRERAEKIAAETGATLRIIRVRCDPETAKERIRQRDGISDADVSVYQRIRDSFEPVERDGVTVEVDNSGTKADTRRQLAAVL